MVNEILTTLHTSILCDEDGWTFKANKEQNYPHFFHPFSPAEIVSLQISGDLAISFVGFGSEGMVAPSKSRINIIIG